MLAEGKRRLANSGERNEGLPSPAWTARGIRVYPFSSGQKPFERDGAQACILRGMCRWKPHCAVLVALLAGGACANPAPSPNSPGASARGEATGAEHARETETNATAPESRAPSLPAKGVVNVLRNPGFEMARDHWTQMGTSNWGAFDIVSTPTHSGTGAARLQVHAAAGEVLPPSRVFGVVQEVRGDELPGAFPETLAGWFFVQEWTPPPPGVFVYLQVVAIIWGDPRTPALTGAAGATNYQVRFMLGGSATAPFAMSNAKYVFLTRDQPAVGQWVPFEIPLRQSFQEQWGVVPEQFEFIRILYEARWDHRPASAAVSATVLYDDLFVGYGTPGWTSEGVGLR